MRCSASGIVLIFAVACGHSSAQPAPARMPPPAPTSAPRVPAPAVDSTREYRGEWESGFEMSVFRGCNGTVPANVWVTLAPGATLGTDWSDKGTGANTRTYYVRVRAILRGPADRRRIGSGYGHLNAADYELYITRVIEVKTPGEPNCVIKR